MVEQKNEERPKYLGVAAQSKSIFCQKEPRNTKAIFGVIEARLFETLTAKFDKVNLVQVGANDGISADPISRHAIAHNWRCMLVEPLPEPAKRLKETYKSLTDVEFVQCAIWADEGEATFYAVEGEDVLSSFSRETIMLHELKFDDLPSMIKEVQVPTRRLDTLCKEHGFEEPHILAIDAEGCDDVVLSSFDLDTYQPNMIVMEHFALSEEASTQLSERLLGLGYEIFFDRHELIALHSAKFDSDEIKFYQDIMDAARNN